MGPKQIGKTSTTQKKINLVIATASTLKDVTIFGACLTLASTIFAARAVSHFKNETPF